MRDIPIEPKKEPHKEITDWDTFDQNVINKIKEKRKSQIVEEMLGEGIPHLRN